METMRGAILPLKRRTKKRTKTPDNFSPHPVKHPPD
jgi:hypothetical protein